MQNDLGPTIDTNVNGEYLNILYASDGNTTTAHVLGSPYAITGSLSDGSGLLSDYDVTLLNGNLTVTPYQFTHQIGDDAHVYGSTDDLQTTWGRRSIRTSTAST